MESSKELAREIESSGRALKYALLFRGGLALALGMIVLLQPGLALRTLILLFGIFVIIDGIFAIVGSAVTRDESWGWGVFFGLVGVGIGVVALRRPEGVETVLILVIAAWALVAGLFQIYGAFVLRSAGARSWGWILVAGLASFAVGLIFFVDPSLGAKTISLLFGIYMVVLGLALLLAAFAFRGLSKDLAAELRSS